jgi:hypothetical protein
MSNVMKRIILSLVVMAFAVAVQADDAKSCHDKVKAGCCDSKVKTSTTADTEKAQGGCCASKVKTSVETKGTCPFAASAAGKQSPVKQTALLSPKAVN